MITIDCGEGRHSACVGFGDQPYLIPQEAGRRFECRCHCHIAAHQSFEITLHVTPSGEISDGHHTFRELYRYRMLYNAALFSLWARIGLHDVHKSRLHHDGTVPFGDADRFVVVAELPTGQVSNHYRVKDWDLFDVPERDLPNVWDGHTPAEAANRLEEFLRSASGRRSWDVDPVGWAGA